MQETVRMILSDAPWTRLFITGNRLARLDIAECTQEERLEIIYWLIVCGKHAQAHSTIKCLNADVLTHEEQAMLYTACLRLSLQNYELPLPAEPQLQYLPRWARKFLQLQKDIAYPLQCKNVTLSLNSSKGLFLKLWIECVACGTQMVTGTCSNLVLREGLQLTEWLCPHCLAKQHTDRHVLRDVLWEKFTEYFTSLAVDSSGRLTESDAAATVLLAKDLEPYAPVRFCSMRPERIGHLCLAGIRIMEQMAGSETLTLDFYGIDTENYVANTTLSAVWRRFFNATVAAQQLYYLAHNMNLRHLAPLVQTAVHQNAHRGRYAYPLQLNFSEMQQGLRALEAMGIPRGAKIACLFVRDAAYLSSFHPATTDTGNSYRNADIDAYQKACEELAARGWYVLRMGAAVERPLAWASERIIDYATRFRTEFMDIWLLLYNDLCIASGSGPDALIMMRNAPLLLVNAVDLWYVSLLNENVMVLPKHMLYTQSRQPLLLEKYLREEAAFEVAVENSKNGKITYIDNTSDEIYDALCEMLERMENPNSFDPQVEELQQYYRNLTKGNYLDWGATSAYFSTKYLLTQAK